MATNDLNLGSSLARASDDRSFFLQLEVDSNDDSEISDFSSPSPSSSGCSPSTSNPSIAAVPDSLSSPPFPESSCTSPPSATTHTEISLGNLDNYIAVGTLKFSEDAVLLEEVEKLKTAGWIRTDLTPCKNEAAQIIYVLPDDVGQTIVPRSNTSLRRALKLVMSKLEEHKEEPVEAEDSESLFYIFNTLESPKPDVEAVSDSWAKAAMEDILNQNTNGGLIGLKTSLYPYQRRSAALMIQKESEPADSLDPRLQTFQGPTQAYYYDKEEGTITRDKRLYSGTRGGVLAETMGYGKTLICLALILATKGYFPAIPSEYLQDLHPMREKTASLLEMAASTAGRCSIPWKSFFDRLRATQGIYPERCISACERNRGSYSITQVPKYHRAQPRTTHLQISSGTLVIVPPNLVDHWLHEIDAHTEGLNVLVLREKADEMPPASALLQYDLILLSKTRFDKENGGFSASSRASQLYDSPMKEIHWLRIIVDEGHNFSSTVGKSNAIHLLERLHVERRWVVSGTPSAGLYGVEVSLASQETLPNSDHNERATAVLQTRKDASNILDEELKNLDKLRRIIVDFLCLKPWANRGADTANWAKYIKPIGADGNRRMATSLRPTLQSVIVRHRAEDINRDLTLPSLHNKVVYLEPTLHDKLSQNMFIFTLAINAVTSERRDQDYMFHPSNRKHLSALINNLRHAGFWWTGFKRREVKDTLKIARKYLERNQHGLSPADLTLLYRGISIAKRTLACSSWNVLSLFDEIGVFVQDFPEHAREMWSIDGSAAASADAKDGCDGQQPLLLGLIQAREAQRFVTARLCASDPGEGIAGAGIRTKQGMQDRIDGHRSSTQNEPRTNIPVQMAVRGANDNPVHAPKFDIYSNKNKKFSKFKALPADSYLANTKLVATSSAKLTYLMDRILELQETEKIIIFYENQNNAVWVAEGLELLGVEFRIYANTLKPTLKAKYLSVFSNTETVRVLLMDLRQASHGLHITSASRIFILTPIWDPNIESQAIKRAHRISQTRPVYVETLVLKDTLEHKMLSRRKQMSSAEMQHAEKDMLNDNTMNHIIQTTGYISITRHEKEIPAYLKNKPGFFDRHKLPVPGDYDENKKQRTRRRSKGKFKESAIALSDSDSSTSSVKKATKRKRKSKSRKSVLHDSSEDDVVISRKAKRRKRRKARFADENDDLESGLVN